MHNIKKTYILVDNVPGNSNQARRISEICKLTSTEIHLDYSIFGSLHNNLPIGLFRLKKHSRAQLSEILPDIVISSGRRAAAIAVEIKKRSPHTKLIQIMNPELPLDLFDVVVLPRHDIKKHFLQYKNILWIDGAVSNPDRKKIEAEGMRLRKEYSIDTSISICSLIIGGATGKKAITINDIDEIMSIVLDHIKKTNAALVITTSRRTDSNVVQHIENYIQNNKNYKIVLYKYSPHSSFNPYWGMIGASSHIVATSDSISMCSEIASCTKQLFLYGTDNMLKKKHKRFMNSLVERGIARNLIDGIIDYKPNELNQTDLIHSAINKFLN